MRKKNFINQMLVGKQLENLCQFQFSNRWLHEVLNFQVPYLKNLSLQHHILAIFCQNGLAHKILFYFAYHISEMPEALCWNDFRHFYFNYNDKESTSNDIFLTFQSKKRKVLHFAHRYLPDRYDLDLLYGQGWMHRESKIWKIVQIR